uniref:Uncharacterized protein n=1 Tax=Cucumis melo TaxID=3656 RepID=A0A9I9EJ14_CUCME
MQSKPHHKESVMQKVLISFQHDPIDDIFSTSYIPSPLVKSSSGAQMKATLLEACEMEAQRSCQFSFYQ